jgi:alpha-beta hydrolase superfamily lysophospholipase
MGPSDHGRRPTGPSESVLTSLSLDHVPRESTPEAAEADRTSTVVPQPQRGAVPFVFGPAAGRCLGWYHPPRGPARNTGVVLCRPVGWEGTSAYEAFTKLAEYLADAGFAVLRFDYHGTGDSAGSDADPDRVAAWLTSIDAAIDEVRRLGRVSEIALCGVRMGATLAATAASRRGGVSSLVMWAPCVTGRSFARELKASTLLREGREEAPAVANGDLEALGFLYTAQTLKDLGTLDLLRLSPLPAPEVMVIGRDDLPGEGPLPQKWRDAGVQLTYAELPGFASMMVEVHESDVAHQTLEAITHWLVGRHPVAAASAYGQAERTMPEAIHADLASGAVFDGVREIPLLFGGEHRLFGILSEPATPLPAHGSRAEHAILMLNVGTNHRVGPNRLYVRMARRWAAQGYRAFRFDLAGLGDSGSAAGFSATRLFDKASVSDVQLAMDALAERGCKHFIVIGLCSGAYVAFQAVLADPRVVGQVLMNPRRLVGKEDATLQTAMSQNFKSTQFYTKQLFDPSTYRRLLQGDIDVRGIAGRMRVLAELRVQRLLERVSRRAPAEDDMLAQLGRACARGVDALFIVSNEDDGLDYLELQLGPRGRHMRKFSNFRMQFIDGDHTFSRADIQEQVIAIVLKHLNELTART